MGHCMHRKEKMDVLRPQIESDSQREVLAELKRNAKEIELQKAKIKARTAEVENVLRGAKLTLEAAQNAVRGISRKHLDEIRALMRPPPSVVKTLQAVCMLMVRRALISTPHSRWRPLFMKRVAIFQCLHILEIP